MSTQDTTSALTTREIVADAVDMLNDGHLILGHGEVDYAAAELLDVLRVMHDEPGSLISLASMPQVREFARLVVEGQPL